MSAAEILNEDDEAVIGGAVRQEPDMLPPPAPHCFVRQIATPPGTPWDQARAADLEARAGAPLAVERLLLSRRRLEPWRLGLPGRFAVAYAREEDVGDGAVLLEVDGRPIGFTFATPAKRALATRRALLRLVVAAAAAIAAVVVIGGLASSRMEQEARLARLEAATAQRQAVLARRRARDQEARALDAAGLHGRTLQDAIADLAWVARARDPSAAIDRVHWQPEALRITARGDKRPLTARDRELKAVSSADGATVWESSRAAQAAPSASPAPKDSPR